MLPARISAVGTLTVFEPRLADERAFVAAEVEELVLDDASAERSAEIVLDEFGMP